MSDDPITVDVNGEEYADVRIDGELAASVVIVDEDQVKVRLHDPQVSGDTIDVWFLDRPQEDDDA
ncbi:hypothetical protein HUG10_21245 (plasmid) [Halorarum halophilum]|uniref:Uncharacterized protein n=1 Tax=Halorarum halophilum TaxID=2743090 RepID=A0A7D5KPB9_9EURY|nr:hypothetical protein [Halobaculum halophilum]QLG30115.1 hypothetical protein HUG10_21245 [Halobaculum halophilum]